MQEKKWTDQIKPKTDDYVLHIDSTCRWYIGKSVKELNEALYPHRIYHDSPVKELLFPLSGVGGAQHKMVNSPLGPLKCYYYESQVGLGSEGPKKQEFVHFLDNNKEPRRMTFGELAEKLQLQPKDQQISARL